MHLRRAVLLIAIVLGLTALAASLAPSRQSSTSPTAPPPAAPAPPSPDLSGLPTPIPFSAPAPKSPPVTNATPGAHVTIEVSTSVAGQATIPSLGLTAEGDPNTPATFDVVLPESGRIEVKFAAPFGAPETVGIVDVAVPRAAPAPHKPPVKRRRGSS